MLAISVDHPEESRLLVDDLGLSFPLLSDPDATVIGRYGVRMAHEQLAVPAVFVIRSDGAVAWRFVSQGVPERPTAQTLLDVLSEMESRSR